MTYRRFDRVVLNVNLRDVVLGSRQRLLEQIEARAGSTGLSIGAELVPEAEEAKARCIDNVCRLGEDFGEGCGVVVVAGADNMGPVLRLKPFPDQMKVPLDGRQPCDAIEARQRPTRDDLIGDIEKIAGHCNQIDRERGKALRQIIENAHHFP